VDLRNIVSCGFSTSITCYQELTRNYVYPQHVSPADATDPEAPVVIHDHQFRIHDSTIATVLKYTIISTRRKWLRRRKQRTHPHPTKEPTCRLYSGLIASGLDSFPTQTIHLTVFVHTPQTREGFHHLIGPEWPKARADPHIRFLPQTPPR